MFAVPGWSVSSKNLKTQTVKPSNPIGNGPPPQSETIDGEAKAGKKRKRSSGRSNPPSEVNSTNLAQLWETVIEGKPKPKKKKSSRDSKSKAHGEDEQKAGHDAKEAESNPGAGGEVVPEEVAKKSKELKEKTKEKKKNKKYASSEESKTAPSDTPAEAAPKAPPLPPPKPVSHLTPLQAAMRQKLISARFRHLNQTLYTTPSAHSLELFQQNPEMFQEYHEGFRRQVEVWPENPVEGYIQQVRARGVQRGPPPGRNKGAPEATALESAVAALPRSEGICHIADLGCGDAGLSQGLQKDVKKLKLKISSYDLQSPSPLVTRADIANLAVGDGSVDVAIFCLALMGTNWIEFVEEAYRILRWKGELWVAEIKSRFGRVGGKRVDHSVGNRNKKPDKKALKKQEEEGDDMDLAVNVDGQEDTKQATDVSAFVEVLRKRGFVLQGQADLKNRMFVKMHFLKGLTPLKGKCVPVPKGMAEMGMETWKKKPKGKFIEDDEMAVSSEASVLKPCVYKLR